METLYRENVKIVSHYLYSLCKDDELTQDLTQETFLKAYESLERFDGSCKISTWLCQIAKHLLYQHYAKAGKVLSTELEDTLPAKENTEKTVLNRIELLDCLKELQKLPELMREVVYLRAMSDLSYKEIGEILGKSENWARVTFYRAKEIPINKLGPIIYWQLLIIAGIQLSAYVIQVTRTMKRGKNTVTSLTIHCSQINIYAIMACIVQLGLMESPEHALEYFGRNIFVILGIGLICVIGFIIMDKRKTNWLVDI